MSSRNRPDTVQFSGVVHGEANCDDCPWQSSNYRNALGTAKLHHNRTGHTVHCEVGTSVTYAVEGSAYVKEYRK